MDQTVQWLADSAAASGGRATERVDIVIAVGSQRVEQVSDLLRMLGRDAVGQLLAVRVLRPIAGVFREIEVEVTPVRAPR